MEQNLVDWPLVNSYFFLIDIRNWFSNIEQHASEGVNKILIGNKCDMPDKKVTFVEKEVGAKPSRKSQEDRFTCLPLGGTRRDNAIFAKIVALRQQQGQHTLIDTATPISSYLFFPP